MADFIKPYSQQILNLERRVFNYGLSRARMTMENVFGIWAGMLRAAPLEFPHTGTFGLKDERLGLTGF